MNTPNPSTTAGAARAKTARSVVLWAVQALIAAAFLMAAYPKLSGQPGRIAQFDRIGLGQWFRYFTGGAEFLGAVLLFLPRKAALGGAILGCVSIGAAAAHILVLGGTPASPLFLGVLCAVIVWGRRDGARGRLRNE